MDAAQRFLEKLAGVADPERKRKIIGERVHPRLRGGGGAAGHGSDYLVQGTLYPDVIESVSVKGPSATIKTHHNVGGLPEKMGFKLVEPLRELFKDEVREVGRELGLLRRDRLAAAVPRAGPGRPLHRRRHPRSGWTSCARRT